MFAGWTFFSWVALFLKTLLGLVVAVLASAIGGIYFFQHRAIYPSQYPEGSRETVMKPDDPACGITSFSEPELTTPDGVKLKTYLMLAKGARASDDKFYKTRPTVLFFHANAGNMGHRLPVAKVLVEQMKLNVLMLSYRGYGLSEGTPSEKGLKLDAQTALDFVTNHVDLGKAPILFYGQSLGGAVAINLARDNPNVPAALILENTFTSVPDLIPSLLPGLQRLTFLLHQIWPSATLLAALPSDLPILLLSGGKDEIVPQSQMDELKKIANNRGGKGKGSAKTEFRRFDKGTHNDTVAQKGYFEAFHKFVESFVSRTSSGFPAGGRGARFAS